MNRPDPYALRTVQQWFQAVITHPDGVAGGVQGDEARGAIEPAAADLERVITRSRKLDAAGRLAVYANAYTARLLECLAESFPVLARALGEEAFEGFAFGYLQDHPSRSYTLDHLADHFADYLDRNRPGPGADPAMAEWAAFLVDLARLEWTIEKVFDGPGVESQRVLEPSDLAAVGLDQWPEARLVPVVCLTLMRFDFPVNDYFTAARRDPDGPEPALPPRRVQYVAITRRDYVVRRVELTAEQFHLLQALQAGEPVARAIESALASSDLSDEQLAGRLQTWFAEWAADRLFARVDVPGAGPTDGS